MKDLYHYIKNQANNIGFDICGIAPVESLSGEQEFLKGWNSRGYNSTMGWIEANGDKREDITNLVDGAKTVIVCGLSYLTDGDSNGVASYAQGVDYHFVIKNMLRTLAEDISCRIGREIEYRVFSDSAPIFERAWAVRAGIGWIGRNKMVINREYGSYTLLGELVCDIDLKDSYDSEDGFNGCGECRRCIEACPGGALKSDGLDSCSCVSYLTIEHSGDFTTHQRSLIDRSGYIFGCDICMDICPWNIKAKKHLTPVQSAKAKGILSIDRESIPQDLESWLAVIESGFKQRFKGSPLLRAGKKKIARNLKM